MNTYMVFMYRKSDNAYFKIIESENNSWKDATVLHEVFTVDENSKAVIGKVSGRVYNCKMTGPDSISYTRKELPVGLWHKIDEVEKWLALDEVYKVGKRAATIKKDEAAFSNLKGLRDQYWQTRAQDRPAFLAAVISKIIGG